MTLRRGLRAAASSLVVILCACCVAALAALNLALPSERGNRIVVGLDAPAEIGFDALGIPHIVAASRRDAFAALGYATARDRLFQMDMMRRKAAGRLAEVLGRSRLTADRRSRILGLEHVADRVLASLPESQRDALVAYAAGVNLRLAEAIVPPFEFLVLGYRPEAWRPRDSLLVLLALETELSDTEFQERMASVMRRALPASVVAFLLPESDCFNEMLAPRDPDHCSPDAGPFDELERIVRDAPRMRASGLLAPGRAAVGSNGWVVGPSRTVDGRAILANDMHLGLSAPDIWYRAELTYGAAHLSGLTLPGVPLVVTGSNGKVAWGFTNLRADVLDLVAIDSDPQRPDRYRTPEGERPFTERIEVIHIQGAPDETLRVRATIWGPVASEPLLGHEVAIRWTALDPAATNLDMMDLDDVGTAQSAIALFHRAGGPPLNVLLADNAGHIAWTVMGRLPRRDGFDGLFSESWADGARGWRGDRANDDLPTVIDPPSGFLVNTNQRMLSSADFAPTLGHEYQGGYRAARIAEQLRDAAKLAESDMLRLQLDTTTDYYRYYQKLALKALSATDGDASLRRTLEAWDGKAEIDSSGLPLLVEFGSELTDAVLAPIVAKCRALAPDFQYGWSQSEEVARRIIEAARPRMLPDPRYEDWNRFIVSILAESARRLVEQNGARSIEALTWGRVNVVDIRHAFSYGAPFLGALLDMPVVPLPGCVQCVRYSEEGVGANARMTVSPSREADGVLEMSGGQSGQPASPHYADQQTDWVMGGRPPFLGGAVGRRITLQPAPR